MAFVCCELAEHDYLEVRMRSAGCTAPARWLAGASGPALGTAAAAWWRPSLLPAPASLLLGGARGYAKYPPHTELQMPSLSPTMNQASGRSV